MSAVQLCERTLSQRWLLIVCVSYCML